MITKFCSLITISFIIFSFSFSQSGLPRVFSAEANKLFSLREDYLNGKLKNDSAIKNLKRQADKLLDIEPFSVMDKAQIPPSGDKHDYMSMGKYWWPNPDIKDGLPYVRKDGEVNPEVKEIADATNAAKLSKSVEILSVAYYITNDSKYSNKAAQLLRVWFLDEETRMNPHLNYAQFIPGITEGRGIGIIDLHNFYRLIDAIGLLENSPDWTNEDDIKIKKWFNDYLDWLKTSKNGIEESETKNNHSTWYDVQVVSYLFFLDQKDEAKEYLQNVSKKRIASQIKEDGSQPEELARTNGISYTLFNLKAHFVLAVFGGLVGADLWNYKTENSGSIRQALDYFLPYVLAPDKWEYQQISEINNANDVYPILLLAKKNYDENLYSDWIKKIFGDKDKIRIDSFL